MKFKLVNLLVFVVFASVVMGCLRAAHFDLTMIYFAGYLLAPLGLAVLSSFFQGIPPEKRLMSCWSFLTVLAIFGLVFSSLSETWGYFLATLFTIIAWSPQLIVLSEVHFLQRDQQLQERFEKQRQKTNATEGKIGSKTDEG